MTYTYHYEGSDSYCPVLMIELDLMHPDPNDRRICNAKGKIDTGADMCVIPLTLKEDWHLQKAGTIHTRDYRGIEQETDTYRIRIVFKDLVNQLVEVIVARRQNVLIGRDILNKLKLHADGKEQVFSLSDP
jgi:predicted aspartyl protease